MTTLPELLESLRGVSLDIVTYDRALNNDRTYAELRQAIRDTGGTSALPTLIQRYRTGRELRAASQSIGGYADRRQWLNDSVNAKLDEVEAPTGSPTPSAALPPALVTTSVVASPPPEAMSSYTLSLHPDLVARCGPYFEAGDYDTCLMNAFRRVEVRIRQIGQFPATDIGVTLVTNAFSIRSGRALITLSEVAAEQEGYHQLFRGAIASFKNPLSHHEVGHDDQAQTLELLGLASLLLRLLDKATVNFATSGSRED